MGRRRKFTYLAQFSFIILLLSVGSCSSKEPIFKQLEADAFDEVIQKNSSILILDVRTPSEYQAGHIENAQLINFYDPDFKINLNELNKEKPIAVYCAVGARSMKAMELMQTLGFKEVYHLEAGLNSWVNSEKDIVQ